MRQAHRRHQPSTLIISAVLRLGSSLRRLRLKLANRRRIRRRLPPYIVVALEGEVVEFPPPKPELPLPGLLLRFVPSPPGPQNLSALRRQFEQLALDPRVMGVVLKIGCYASPVIFQSLRDLVLRFRAAGKRIVAYAETFGPFQYYLACACDCIVMPPPAEWDVLGFQNDYLFFKDALDRLGVGVEVVNVSPFKSAGDAFTRNDFSAESRAQAEWLLDARFDELVRGIAEGRKLSGARVRELIDSAPFSAEQAVRHGLLDAARYEDELERYLMPERPAPSTNQRLAVLAQRIERVAPGLAHSLQQAQQAAAEQSGRVWVNFDEVRKSLLLPIRDDAPKVIGVVRIEGLIVPGASRRSPVPIPLLGDEVAGSDSVAQAIRRAEKDDHIAAVILHVDSSGGAVLAADLIAREVRRLRAKKPVVVYMGGVAASGGYYVSALAHCIIAQPLTITGSIGVILLRPNTRHAFEKLGVHRVVLRRGKRAGLFSDAAPLGAEEHEVVADIIARTYDEFKRLVAEGRALSFDALEPICGGRVWTGAQAKDRGLVDALGDFTLALEKARELAGLPADKRVSAILLTPPRQPELPVPFPALANPASHLTRSLIGQLDEARRMLLGARTWAISPWHPGKTT